MMNSSVNHSLEGQMHAGDVITTGSEFLLSAGGAAADTRLLQFTS